MVVHCPGCDRHVPVPDIGPRSPPGIEVTCDCGDSFGVLYTARDPSLIWWLPRHPLDPARWKPLGSSIGPSEAKDDR